jgi:hypothetical protein
MTGFQRTMLILVAAGAVAIGIYQAREVSELRGQVQALKRQLEQQAALRDRVIELRRERDRATNALAAVAAENAALKQHPAEVLKLRGEVGRLRQENASISSSSPLSKVTASPQARKVLRAQQKLGMSVIYKGLAKELKLTPEQSDQLNNLLADHIMADVDHVTTILSDKLTPEQMDALFAAEDDALDDKVRALLGADGLSQFQDYTRNILSTLTAEQFQGMLTGSDAEKAQKSRQLSRAIQEASRAALAAAGLPAGYQTVPILNFKNIASEQDGEQSLKLLDDIYQRAADLAGSFLTPDDLAKFQQFRTTALNNNRMALTLNRTMMAPINN